MRDIMWATVQGYFARNPRTKFAARRYLWYRLIFDERGTSTERNRLKARLYARQRGRCLLCRKPFDDKARRATPRGSRRGLRKLRTGSAKQGRFFGRFH